jgi:hypothetical protein
MRLVALSPKYVQGQPWVIRGYPGWLLRKLPWDNGQAHLALVKDNGGHVWLTKKPLSLRKLPRGGTFRVFKSKEVLVFNLLLTSLQGKIPHQSALM